MTKQLVLSNKDGTARIMGLILGEEKDAVTKWDNTDKKLIASIREVDAESIPVDRTFRNAIRDGGGRKNWAKFDLDSCRTIVKEKWRIVIMSMMGAVEMEQKIASITGEMDKVKLRQAEVENLKTLVNFPAIDAAKSTEELMGLLPAKSILR